MNNNRCEICGSEVEATYIDNNLNEYHLCFVCDERYELCLECGLFYKKEEISANHMCDCCEEFTENRRKSNEIV